MNTTLSAAAILALKWFAFQTGVFADPTDRAPEAALVHELRAAGLISPNGMPTAKGEALLQGSRVVVAEERVTHENYPNAVAVVRTVTAGRDARRRFWTETEVQIVALRFPSTNEFCHMPIACRADTLDQLAFCYRAATVKGAGYNAAPFRHVGRV